MSFSLVRNCIRQKPLTTHYLQLQASIATCRPCNQNETIVENVDTPLKKESYDISQPILSRDLKLSVDHKSSKLAWLESLKKLEITKVGMVDLHPEVFGVYPRIDILSRNIYWQKTYRDIDYGFMPSRAELPGGGRKPWPQKGTGRARHGSIRSPIFLRGAKAHGPRGPTSYFFMLPMFERVLGLRTALSCKYGQNDLVIVDNLEIPTPDPKYLADLADVRFWGDSVLFVDDNDIMPKNMAVSCSQITGFTLMPSYGLNVYSMLKHDTLVLTLSALEKIEGKLLAAVHSTKMPEKYINRRSPDDLRTEPKQDRRMVYKYSAPFEDYDPVDLC